MSRWGITALLFLSVGAERANVHADLPKESDRVVSYAIRARLQPEHKEVHADMDLVWRNTTARPVGELYFHLYLNAFSSRDSTYIREGSGKRGAKFDEEYPGWVRIDRMGLPDGRNLWQPGTQAFVAPDDGNEKDRTLARVALPAPVAPGETIALEIEFRSRLPRVLHRTGWAGDPADPEQLFFMVAQWFPKVAVLQERPDGTLHWNAHQFHRNTEFFSDYGEYRVSITVPESYVVGATGTRVSGPTANPDGTKTVVHRQKDVHDFAWTASPHLRVLEYAWSFDRFCDEAPDGMGERIRALLERTARHRGVSPDEAKPRQEVRIRVLYPPDHDGVKERFQWAAGASLACYGIWFGQYPYEVLTVVDPPECGGAAGGMEYPTLFTVWGDRNAPDYPYGMEGVTIHEFGHQFFYGLLGSNEFEEAWLDEGFTSFTDARVFSIAYGPATASRRYGPYTLPYRRPFDPPQIFGRLRRWSRLGPLLDRLPHPWERPDSLLPAPRANPFWEYLRDMPALHFPERAPIPAPLRERASWLRSRTHDSMRLFAWDFARRGDYRVNSYPKPTVFLYCLRGLMGEEAFDRAMYLYASSQRFRHPTAEDFLSAVRAQTAEEQRAFLDRFLEAMTATASRLDVAIVDVSQREVEKDAPEWEWTIRVQRRGTVPVPITIACEDVDGEATRLGPWHSDGAETTRTFRVRRAKELATVRLGPEWLRFVDRDLSNNARALGRSDRRAATALAARWTLFVEDVVRSYAGVGR